MNWAIIMVNVFIFTWMVSLPLQSAETLLHHWGVIPARFVFPSHWLFADYPPGSYLTLFSYMFLHGGWLHLISNMWALWLFGDNVEDRMGHALYALFYVVCGLLAIGAHVFLNVRSTLPTVGASGSIAGIMGAYFLYYRHAKIIVLLPVLFFPFFFEVPAAVYLVIWIVLQVFSGTYSLMFSAGDQGGVAFWSHIGGFLGGMLLGWWWCRNPRGKDRCYWERDEYMPW